MDPDKPWRAVIIPGKEFVYILPFEGACDEDELHRPNINPKFEEGVMTINTIKIITQGANPISLSDFWDIGSFPIKLPRIVFGQASAVEKVAFTTYQIDLGDFDSQAAGFGPNDIQAMNTNLAQVLSNLEISQIPNEMFISQVAPALQIMAGSQIPLQMVNFEQLIAVANLARILNTIKSSEFVTNASLN